MGRIFGHLKGLHATYLINVGVRLGLFQLLDRHPDGMTPSEVAEAAQLETRYVRIWCETACALELLDQRAGSRYVLAPGIDEVLARPGGASYVGEFPAAHLQVARDYARYEDAFRTGATHPFGDHDAQFLEAVADATRVLPRMFTDGVLPQLDELRATLEAVRATSTWAAARDMRWSTSPRSSRRRDSSVSTLTRYR